MMIAQDPARMVLLLASPAGGGHAAVALADQTSDSAALRVFEQQIMPIFRSPNPPSSVQCHLFSVDINDYILPSHVDTFLALRKKELIGLENPKRYAEFVKHYGGQMKLFGDSPESTMAAMIASSRKRLGAVTR